MLQQQEATQIVVLKISQFMRSVTTEQRGKTGFENCEEKNSVTYLPVESRLKVSGSREGNENESGLGKRQKKESKRSRGSERRWRQNSVPL